MACGAHQQREARRCPYQATQTLGALTAQRADGGMFISFPLLAGRA